MGSVGGEDTVDQVASYVAAVPGPRRAPAVESRAGCSTGPGTDPDPGPETDPETDAEPLLAGHAWLLRDVTHVPGVLTLRDGRLRFVSTLRTVLDATPTALELTLPRTRRGPFGLVLRGEHVGLSVVRPPGAVTVPRDVVARAGADLTVGDLHAGERWYALLAPLAVPRPWPVRQALSALAPAWCTRTPAARTSELPPLTPLRTV